MFRLTIQRKVFLAMSLLAAAIVLLLITLTMWNLEKGFSRYAAEMELGKLEAQVEALQHHYAEMGSWELLRNNDAAWRTLTRQAGSRLAPKMKPPPPPRFAANHVPPFPPRALKAQQPPADPFGIFPRLSLLDNQGQLIIGSVPSVNAVWRPLYFNGTEIGRLLLTPNHNPESSIAAAFLSSQMRNLWLSGLAGLLLSLLVSWWLSRHFLAPIRDLNTGAHTIARGDFASRIPVRGEDELAELAEDFNQMAERLERMELGRSRWISDTSHELRTPLSVLRAEIEAMQDGVRPTDGETLARLHRQVLQLGKLVDDLRQTQRSEVDGLAFDFNEMNLLSLLHEACDGFLERFNGAGLSLDLAALPETGEAWLIEADGDRLLQVFNNLIENSLRYTQRGGTLQLSASINDAQFILIFDDTPPAPPVDALPQLFDRFFRVEQSRSRSLGGSGLGLAICQQIIIAHGGNIEAANSPLGGLRIRIMLPQQQ
ncbi:MAG: two-component sensor histidine kinase [Zetaproteobacteria bacterium CG_4_9_14_3_um_filter_49_83]|nr:MAG: hypothetical protein AUJ56_09295 [Zetaproteobacteria bacterium CG1_02_49_23]PIQ33321.1 MAG: two-component sensor histidine kinase [Zetaproteobacteria bacterium CG17_big_fil_post_rev_8_21_14_2_50_50_13]PIV29024.1 MAG: two-component sensor histidine kinase [Zetaproteobacteria bacterium CG02_land_8_20_14_3_00_50_9]PIY57057.1 MAG: two-component sensor histidine kinase [Zetaproteobacteria bacterium CG_4_10_14_0_8_um_filter_49_80]PJA34403.1 MAG: two-component sensor histidine kinase [Zetaprot